MYFVDIVESYDFCAAVQRINFFFSLSITLYVLSTTDLGE